MTSATPAVFEVRSHEELEKEIKKTKVFHKPGKPEAVEVKFDHDIKELEFDGSIRRICAVVLIQE